MTNYFNGWINDNKYVNLGLSFIEKCKNLDVKSAPSYWQKITNPKGLAKYENAYAPISEAQAMDIKNGQGRLLVVSGSVLGEEKIEHKSAAVPLSHLLEFKTLGFVYHEPVYTQTSSDAPIVCTYTRDHVFYPNGYGFTDLHAGQRLQGRAFVLTTHNHEFKLSEFVTQHHDERALDADALKAHAVDDHALQAPDEKKLPHNLEALSDEPLEGDVFAAVYAHVHPDAAHTPRKNKLVAGAAIVGTLSAHDNEVIVKRYNPYTDYMAVYKFLEDIYALEHLNSYMLPQYFEYAQHHGYFDVHHAHHMAVWRIQGKIVGYSAYEMKLGECHLVTDEAHAYLLPDLLNWAEREIAVKTDNKMKLKVWTTNKEADKAELLTNNGYKPDRTEAVTIFKYAQPFKNVMLPEGFKLIDGKYANLKKLSDCFWHGFNHAGDNPDDGTDGRRMMMAPHADASLTTIVVAPDGSYACALGMWFDAKHKYTYLEPLATVPKYRKMGLAAYALTEAMKKTKAKGAAYCFGGSGVFYEKLGFETIMHRDLWVKVW